MKYYKQPFMVENKCKKGDYEKMMKRFLVAMLSVAIAANLVACGCGTAGNNDTVVEDTAENVPAETPDNTPAAAPEDTPAEMPTPEVGDETQTEDTQTGEAESDISGETVGAMLAQEFHAIKAENAEITAEEVADTILANPMIQFGGASMEVTEGLLTGFGNAEITGFNNGVMFAPMIGTIPFVGYVFTLDEGADVDAFMQTLKDNADPRWNICTEAEETIIESADNMVFFVMCPAQFEE